MALTIEHNIPLAPFTSFKIGGPSLFFTRAKSEQDVFEAVRFAKEKGVPIFILGNGSNVLISDNGFPGLTIKMELQATRIDGERLIIGAGVPMAKAAVEAAKYNLSGFEWALGIPGTVGASVYGNAGCFGGEMKDVVETVEFLDAGTGDYSIRKFANADCGFDYRESVFKRHPEWTILNAQVRLKKITSEDTRIREAMKRIAEHRVREQDIGAKTAGSTFKGVPITEESMARIQNHRREWKKGHDQSSWLFENRRGCVSAGFLIEYAGLKGIKIGEAMVSPKHANFIVNTGNATAEQVIMLMGVIKERVHRKFGVFLEEEIRYIGF